ncbi:hypothetical protein V2I01_36870 [Micromonospora sp. BRA006-A]|nr:hypothetical protein [Micromonospora sp. BRA006-A]
MADCGPLTGRLRAVWWVPSPTTVTWCSRSARRRTYRCCATSAT